MTREEMEMRKLVRESDIIDKTDGTELARAFNHLWNKYIEQEPILDKIRAEIEELDRYYDNDYFSTNNCPMYKCNEVLQIIDKYRTERK